MSRTASSVNAAAKSSSDFLAMIGASLGPAIGYHFRRTSPDGRLQISVSGFRPEP